MKILPILFLLSCNCSKAIIQGDRRMLFIENLILIYKKWSDKFTHNKFKDKCTQIRQNSYFFVLLIIFRGHQNPDLILLSTSKQLNKVEYKSNPQTLKDFLTNKNNASHFPILL